MSKQIGAAITAHVKANMIICNGCREISAYMQDINIDWCSPSVSIFVNTGSTQILVWSYAARTLQQLDLHQLSPIVERGSSDF